MSATELQAAGSSVVISPRSSAVISPKSSAAHSSGTCTPYYRKISMDKVAKFKQVIGGLNLESDEDKSILLQAVEDLITQTANRADDQDGSYNVELADQPVIQQRKRITKSILTLICLCVCLFVVLLITSGLNVYFSTTETEREKYSLYKNANNTGSILEVSMDFGRTFGQATVFCQKKGMYLVMPKTSEVQDALAEKVDHTSFYWLGLQKVGPDEWEWVDGTPLGNDSRWVRDQFRHHYHGCVYFWISGVESWNEDRCDSKYLVVCQNTGVALEAPPDNCYDVKSKNESVMTVLSNGIRVVCDTITDLGGWVVMQRRTSGDLDFDSRYFFYQYGFGNLNDDFWLGLENVYMLTKEVPYELRVEFTFEGKDYYAQYSHFKISSPNNKFRLAVSGYSGNAGDSLSYHNDMLFSTKKRDNDKEESKNCAEFFKGGWWYNDCGTSTLNGGLLKFNQGKSFWYNTTGREGSVTRTEMKIRPLLTKEQFGNLGQNVKIECIVQAKPPAILTWVFSNQTYNNTPITSDEEKFIVTNDSLKIKNLTKEDEGTYTCMAEQEGTVIFRQYKIKFYVVDNDYLEDHDASDGMMCRFSVLVTVLSMLFYTAILQ